MTDFLNGVIYINNNKYYTIKTICKKLNISKLKILYRIKNNLIDQKFIKINKTKPKYYINCDYINDELNKLSLIQNKTKPVEKIRSENELCYENLIIADDISVYSAIETSKILNITIKTLYNLSKTGKIKYNIINGRSNKKQYTKNQIIEYLNLYINIKVPGYYTIEEICNNYKISKDKLYKRIKNNNIDSKYIIRHHINGKNQIYLNSIYIDSNLNTILKRKKNHRKYKNFKNFKMQLPVILQPDKIISDNEIIYENVIYKTNNCLKNYFFNCKNIKKIIYKNNNMFYLYKFKINKNGRERMNINRDNEKKYNINVARAILKVFKPIKDDNNYCAGHFDDLNDNNDIKNLYWITPSENMELSGINIAICKNIYRIVMNDDLLKNKYLKDEIFFKKNDEFIKIPIYENFYISKDGTCIKHNNQIIPYFWQSTPKYSNYKVIYLKNNRYFVHILMAYAKYGIDEVNNPNNVIRHLNDLKENNSYDNILIGTRQQNTLDGINNHNKYKQLRKILLLNESIEIYNNILNDAINCFNKKLKEKYFKLKLKLDESNKGFI
jgi:hypothetical protein